MAESKTAQLTTTDTPTKWNLQYRQMRFAQLVFSGQLNISAAYKEAGYESKLGSSTYASASKLLRIHKIQRYLAHLAVIAKRTARQATLTRQRKRELLCDIAEDAEKQSDRINAIQVDNRMTGDDAPIRLEGEITLGAILEGIAPSVGLPGSDAVDVESSPTG